MREAILLYSGGTDSTLTAALIADRFDRIHLLTFSRFGVHKVGNSATNVAKLRARFGEDRFVHVLLDVDRIFRFVSYHGYPGMLRRHGFFVLSTCGLCKLAMHTRALLYGLEHGIPAVFDGANKGMRLFPAQMAPVVEEFRRFYARFGLTYETPVFDMPPPPSKELPDVLRARLGAAPAPRAAGAEPTTGERLHALGITGAPDVKGTDEDRRMQGRCFQLVLPLMMAKWIYRAEEHYDDYEKRAVAFFRDRIATVAAWVDSHLDGGRQPSEYSKG